jgi:pyrroloquinoline-quinone synthase
MDLVDRIDALIDERHLLGHTFYRQWVAGTLPSENLREYARQYYAFESTFPRILSGLHSRSGSPEVRAALLDNLWDEEHGEANHQELWLRFAEGVGVPREDVQNAEWNQATSDLVDTYRKAAREAPVAAGVAAVYAYERQVPAVAKAKIDGLRDRYGVTDGRTLGFFETHALLDVEHSEAERRIVRELGPADEEAVVAAATSALDGWWRFLDAVSPSVSTDAGEGRKAPRVDVG